MGVKKCSTDPGTTHYHGCECHETARNERIRELEAERDAYKSALESVHLTLNSFVADGTSYPLIAAIRRAAGQCRDGLLKQKPSDQPCQSQLE